MSEEKRGTQESPRGDRGEHPSNPAATTEGAHAPVHPDADANADEERTGEGTGARAGEYS